MLAFAPRLAASRLRFSTFRPTLRRLLLAGCVTCAFGAATFAQDFAWPFAEPPRYTVIPEPQPLPFPTSVEVQPIPAHLNWPQMQFAAPLQHVQGEPSRGVVRMVEEPPAAPQTSPADAERNQFRSTNADQPVTLDEADFHVARKDGVIASPAAVPTAAPFVDLGPPVPDINISSLTASKDLLSDSRQDLAYGLSTDLVFGAEAAFRAATEAGNLLEKSNSVTGVYSQFHSPIASDPRVRGDRAGRLVVSSSYWFPARQDLDTMLNKFDARNVESMVVVKGPYAVQYGPGFHFVDVDFIATPRYACYETHGGTSFEYKFNGQQVYGRQFVEGGSSDWGFRASYGMRTGNDFATGGGFDLPTSYRSGDLDFVIGFDVLPDARMEFRYLRLDQNNVEFPGAVFDINESHTDGFEFKYTSLLQPEFDGMTIEAWYNRTAFTGDTLRPGKNGQIPILRNVLAPFAGNGYAITDVDAASTGYRWSVSWGDPTDWQLTYGHDLIRLNQQLNDVEAAGLPLANNYAIPRSESLDAGTFVEYRYPLLLVDGVTLKAGARYDTVSTESRDTAPGMTIGIFPGAPTTSVAQAKQVGLDQSFDLWAGHLIAELQLTPEVRAYVGGGYAMRAPSLTEMYANGSLITSLQPGVTSVWGDPDLQPEKLTQLDVGLAACTECGTRVRANGFYAWVRDYIIYDDFLANSPLVPDPGVAIQRVFYGNTDFATIAGAEFLGEQDLGDCVTLFGLVSYVEGRDRSRSRSSRLGFLARQPLPGIDPNDRSLIDGVDHETLPGMPPLESRTGVRVHDGCGKWLVEVEARMVSEQNRYAKTLFEQHTPGFTIGNVRSYWLLADNWALNVGCENFGDRLYREHLDFRPGRGVYRPGSTFYVNSEIVY